MSQPTKDLKVKRKWECCVCSSGKGTGGLLYQFDHNWSGWSLHRPDECPQCGSVFGVVEAGT